MYSRSPATLDYRLLCEKNRQEGKENGERIKSRMKRTKKRRVRNNVGVRQVPQDSRELEAEEAKK